MFRYHSLVENKSKLFAIIIFFMVAVLAVPLVLPQIHHKLTLFNVLIHLTAMSVAIFLSTVAIIAYSRLRTQRLLFTTIAFSVFAVSQSFSLIAAEWPDAYYAIVAVELGRLLILATLGIFALSVFRSD